MSDRERESMDQLLIETYAATDPDDEARAAAATVAAFNRIEAERRPLVKTERRRSRLRALILLGGWVAALVLIVRGFVIWPAVAPTVTGVSSSPVVNGAADALSLAPWHLAVGLALLAVTLVFSIRTGLSES